MIAALGAMAPQATLAQALDRTTPNPLLTFNLSEGLGLETNADLDPGVEDAEPRSTTTLGLSYLTATPISQFSLSAGVTVDTPLSSDVSSQDVQVDGPRLDFGYSRAVPSSSLDLSGSLGQTEVSFLRSLTDFIGDDGSIDLPDDFEEFRGEGSRRNASLGAVLTLRDDAPFGITLSTGFDSVSYDDVTSGELIDYRTTDFEASFRFRLTEAASLNAGLRSSVYDEDGDEPVTRYGLDVGGSIDRPAGQIFGQLAFDDTEDGLRTELSFGRELQRPLGLFSGRLGVARDATGELQLTGGVQASRTLPRGSASLSLDQSVQTREGEDEELVTTLAAQYQRNLTPLASLSLDALYGETQTTGGGDSTSSIEFGASLNRQLAEDWSLSLGYRHQQRDETGDELARNESLFLTIGRSFRGGF
ncbi:hypothetical protein [Rubellimicrobium arenae]|uniref:hypothetical protein n=1 Tax=Rubellimicrobium arenae TaxID=2817372 RepID=UPI001B3026D2|nr:hypothetical protein [Rubellimicrobium arenae]